MTRTALALLQADSQGDASWPKQVADVFRACEREQLAYCLLRPAIPGAHDVPDVDLLVSPDHLERFARIAVRSGFVQQRPWGHAPHVFFASYDVESGWLKLDVVTNLRYGAGIRALHATDAAGCLRRRRRRGLVYSLSAADEFVHVLLHCLLDKREFEVGYREHLSMLRHAVEVDPSSLDQVTTQFRDYLAPALTWEVVAAAIEHQRWDMLRARRAVVAARLFRRDALRSIGWHLGSTVGRRLRPISGMLAGEGFTVALIAPDGAGKTTLTRALVRSLPYRTRRVYMGYGAGGGTSGAVGRWLLRLAGSHPPSGSGPKRPARAAGRFAARLGLQVGRSLIVSAHRLFGRAVLLDRHVSEAWLGLETGGSRAALYQRLLQSVSPRVDLVVLLDTEPDVLHRRKPEHPLERLARQRQAYRRLLDRIPGAVVVDATGAAEDVRKALTNVIWQRCIARGNTRAE